MNNIKIIIASLLLFFFAGSTSSFAQKLNRKSSAESDKPKAYHVHQHVMVTMKDGSEVEAVVHGHMTKKKYWVRQWHSGREGMVKEKYMRALTESEVAALKASKKKKKKN